MYGLVSFAPVWYFEWSNTSRQEAYEKLRKKGINRYKEPTSKCLILIWYAGSLRLVFIALPVSYYITTWSVESPINRIEPFANILFSKLTEIIRMVIWYYNNNIVPSKLWSTPEPLCHIPFPNKYHGKSTICWSWYSHFVSTELLYQAVFAVNDLYKCENSFHAVCITK